MAERDVPADADALRAEIANWRSRAEHAEEECAMQDAEVLALLRVRDDLRASNAALRVVAEAAKALAIRIGGLPGCAGHQGVRAALDDIAAALGSLERASSAPPSAPLNG